MKYILIAILSIVLSACQVSYAQTAANPCNNIPQATVGKSPNEISAILELCRGDTSSGLTNIKPDVVSAWGGVAKDIAEAVGIAAKELGVATNEFLNSPAGFLVAFLIVFKIMGAYLAYVFVSIPFTLVMIWVWVKLNLYMTIRNIKYDYKPVLFGLYQRKVVTVVEYGDLDGYITEAQGTTRIFSALTFAVIILASWVVW